MAAAVRRDAFGCLVAGCWCKRHLKTTSVSEAKETPGKVSAAAAVRCVVVSDWMLRAQLLSVMIG